MMTMRHLVFVVLVGCSAGARSSEPPPSDPTLGSGEKSLVQAMLEISGRMHDRFAATDRMHYAIAVSDLERAHREAKLVADLDEPDVLPEWQPFITEIRSAARAVMATADPIAAAHSMAGLGRLCARCHQAANAKLDLVADPQPPSGPELRAGMASHQWAAGQMWKGLISPSTKHWLAGASVLEGAPLTIAAEVGEPPHGLGIADDVARIRMLARRAQSVSELDARAELYGQLLGSCVRCHATIRDR